MKLQPAQIREIRTTIGRTQAEIAALLEVHPITWCRWETGHTTPGPRARRVLEFWHKKYCQAATKNEEVLR